ncbi:MAG: phytanoyl-CoA dioxygenase family protein [Gammaproteobacteria bacterium]|nr:phytanoyl-CoA dioxygenase family protein [Gammaproteobacteria bacterium]
MPAADDVDRPWTLDNQDWWDWYVSLADNEPGSNGEERALPPLPATAAPSGAQRAAELSQPRPLTDAERAQFRTEGYVKLSGVFSAPLLLQLRAELAALLGAAAGAQLDGGVRGRFLSLDMVWLTNTLVRDFVLSPRIGQLAAQLLDVAAVRLYHDNVMSKEPGCGRTPWHYDDHHFPLATRDVITVWIPVQPIPTDMGPLAFARDMEAWRLVESVPFNTEDTSYDRAVTERFDAAGADVEAGPFELGEISFHHNMSFHTAGANRTDRSRIVLSNTYYADGARLVDAPTLVSGDWQKFAPGAAPGERLATAVNPLCWPQPSAGAPT